MTYTIRYGTWIDVKKLARFSKADLRAIKRNIEQKLTKAPDLFGKPLRRSLRGHWSLRVGDYRVIYRIDRDEVLIILIEHRSVVYEIAKNVNT